MAFGVAVQSKVFVTAAAAVSTVPCLHCRYTTVSVFHIYGVRSWRYVKVLEAWKACNSNSIRVLKVLAVTVM
jgi:hypothetical protein